MDAMLLSAVIRKEGRLHVAWTPELDIASQGKDAEQALANLKEAVELYLKDEDAPRPAGTPMITTFEVQDDAAASGSLSS